jgi:hypothetical protein
MQSDNTPLEHQNVPVAHQGLHSFLYDSNDEHSADIAAAVVDSDGTNITQIATWKQQNSQAKVAGVYAVLDGDRTYQYIGYSRDILRSVQGHIAQNGAKACIYLRVKTFKFPKRQEMEALQNQWIAELNYTPTGNAGEASTWARTIGETANASMTEAERNAYEEKKLKLRKAMADPTLEKESTPNHVQSEAEVQRWEKLAAAVKNDDWSSVIESQQ